MAALPEQRWNDTIGRRPTAVIIFFGGACTITWAALFCTLSSLPAARAALAAPEYAVGWLMMRTTSRLRVPLNLALAAPVSAAVPAFSLVKISPLLTAFAADKQARQEIANFRTWFEKWDGLGGSTKRFIIGTGKKFAQLLKWAEGPIDKYGLSYFLSSKVTSTLTLFGGTMAAFHGLDLPALLASWGLSGDLQGEAGLFACAAMMNVLCTPLHFLGAVSAVARLEALASRLWHSSRTDIHEFHEQHVVSARKGPPEAAAGEEAVSEGDPELTEADVVNNLVTNVALITVLLDLSFAIYIIRRMTKSQASNDAKGDAPDAATDGDANADAPDVGHIPMPTAEAAVATPVVAT